MINNSFYEQVLEDIDNMHQCKNEQFFNLLTTQTCKSWREKGEIAFTNWFTSELLHENWATWYIGCSPEKMSMYAVPDTTNPIESFNMILKRFVPNPVSMTNFFEVKILTIFEHIANEISAMQFDHNRSQQVFITNTPLHSGIIHKAANLCLKNSSNRYPNVVKYKNGTGSNTYYFNRSDLIFTK